MSDGILQQIVAGDAPPLVPLTAEQYHRLIETGVLPEGSSIELIDGFLVQKDRADSRSSSPMNQGPIHAFAVRRLMRAVSHQVEGTETGLLAQCQLPVSVLPNHEPEPDVSIIEGPESRYETRIPTASDALAVMEVAHSSRSFDRGKKQQIYAEANIPLFVVVDLVENVVELYVEPDAKNSCYRRCETFSSGETMTLELRTGLSLQFDVSQFLPSS